MFALHVWLTRRSSVSDQIGAGPDQRPLPAVPPGGQPTRETPTGGPARPLPYVVAGVLLAIAIVLPLMPQLYSVDAPRVGGMPFFYWYQLLWVPISAGLRGSEMNGREVNWIALIVVIVLFVIVAVMYPHSVTGVLASKGRNTIRRNAAILPLYSLMLGFLALLGYVAIKAGTKPTDLDGSVNPQLVVPQLFLDHFPAWFAGLPSRPLPSGPGAGGHHVHCRGEPVHAQRLP